MVAAGHRSVLTHMRIKFHFMANQLHIEGYFTGVVQRAKSAHFSEYCSGWKTSKNRKITLNWRKNLHFDICIHIIVLTFREKKEELL
jgi:hypothetical protein